jgi:hypothetical protein
MTAKRYQDLVLNMLQGKTAELRAIPPERLDWSGPGAVLELYRGTAGKDRAASIQAIGQIIRDQSGAPPLLAQVVDIASGLDLAEVEPEVRALQGESVAATDPLRRSIANYLAYRKLLTNGQTAAANGSTPPHRPARKSTTKSATRKK